MRLCVVVAVLALCTLVVTQVTFQDWVIIDNFAVSNINICSFQDNGYDTLPKTCNPTFDLDPNPAGTRIVGRQRDDQITISTGPSGDLVFLTSTIASNFTCGTPAQSAGFAELQYDGIDNSMNLNVDGLANRDFTAGGNAIFFHTEVASDIETIMHVRVYSGSAIGGTSADYCALNFTIPGGNLFKEYITPLTDFVPFGLGCDFAHVGAVDVIIDMSNSADPIISYLTTYGPVPSASSSVSITPSVTPTPSISISITSTRSPSISETQTISETASISITPTPTVSTTSSSSVTPTPSISVSPTSSPSPTLSETPTPSASVSETPSVTASPTITETPTISPSTSVSTSPSVSETPTVSETPSITVSVSVTKSISQSVSMTRTVSETATRTTTPTKSVTASLSPTPTVTSTPSITVSVSVTPTLTISVSITRTPTITGSISKTGSWSPTRTRSISRSLQTTPTPSATKSATASISYTKSPSRTAGASRTPTRTASKSVSPTIGGAPIPTYTVVCPQSGVTINQAFDAAWQTFVPSTGGCAHLATYRTQAEFTALFNAMIEAGVTDAIVGARRDPGNNVYYWDAGQYRSKVWVEPVYAPNPQSIQANCASDGFCLPVMSNVKPITNDNQIGMVLALRNQTDHPTVVDAVPYLIPSTGAACYVYAYEQFDYIADVHGGPPHIFYPALDTFDNHQRNAFLNRQFILPVDSATQTQWIIDELQCGTFDLWLGFETYHTTSLYISAGPGSATQILAGGSNTCSTHYCNFAPGFTGVTMLDSAVSMSASTGYWSVVPKSSSRSTIRQSERCTTTAYCVPNTSVDWYRDQSFGQAVAEGGFPAPNYYSRTYNSVTTVVYLDCACQNPRVDLACLGDPQMDPVSCFTDTNL